MSEANSPYWLSLDLTWPKGTLSIHRCQNNQTPELLEETLISDSFDHSEKLIPALIKTLKNLKLSLTQVGRFITPSGPGSFTGLRIALVSLKAFAAGLKKPIDTVSGAECRALAWNRRHLETKWTNLFVMTQTTQLLAHCATFEKSASGLRLCEERMVATEEILSNLKSENRVLIDGSFKPQLNVESNNVTRFPLQAAFLGENLFQCSSRKTHSEFKDLVNLSPEYFGSSRFDI
jgi:tRNA threonylcarbamoyl adenosine modification protein YeaZ